MTGMIRAYLALARRGKEIRAAKSKVTKRSKSKS